MWHHYPRTILTLRPANAASFTIDLRVPVHADTAARLAAIGLHDPFAVITACNPDGLDVARSENERRTARLRDRLLGAGHTAVRADGRSPDGTHVEPGFAVRMPKPDALAIAAEFRQLGLFWWDGTAFLLVRTDASEEVRLPV